MTVVCIPTRGRAYEQRTLDYLRGTKWEDRTWLGVPNEEHGLHNYPRVLAHNVDGISATRQWIVENAYHADQVIMLDDDLLFSVRRKDEPAKFTKGTSE